MTRSTSPTTASSTRAEEEQRLARCVRRGSDEARRAMIESNLPLVIFIASRYRGSGVELQDMIQDGVFGLDEAVRRFDPSLGFRFSTYARWWIHKAIQNGIHRNAEMIRPPRSVYRNRRRVELTRGRLEAGLGHEAAPWELADATGIDESEVREALTGRKTLSLEHVAEAPDPLANDMDERASENERRAFIRSAVEQLPEPERSVVTLRYGLETRRHSYQEIADRLAVGRDYVRAREAAALARLRRLAVKKLGSAVV